MRFLLRQDSHDDQRETQRKSHADEHASLFLWRDIIPCHHFIVRVSSIELFSCRHSLFSTECLWFIISLLQCMSLPLGVSLILTTLLVFVRFVTAFSVLLMLNELLSAFHIKRKASRVLTLSLWVNTDWQTKLTWRRLKGRRGLGMQFEMLHTRFTCHNSFDLVSMFRRLCYVNSIWRSFWKKVVTHTEREYSVNSQQSKM